MVASPKCLHSACQYRTDRCDGNTRRFRYLFITQACAAQHQADLLPFGELGQDVTHQHSLLLGKHKPFRIPFFCAVQCALLDERIYLPLLIEAAFAFSQYIQAQIDSDSTEPGPLLRLVGGMWWKVVKAHKDLLRDILRLVRLPDVAVRQPIEQRIVAREDCLKCLDSRRSY